MAVQNSAMHRMVRPMSKILLALLTDRRSVVAVAHTLPMMFVRTVRMPKLISSTIAVF